MTRTVKKSGEIDNPFYDFREGNSDDKESENVTLDVRYLTRFRSIFRGLIYILRS